MANRKFSCIKQVVKTVQIPLPATFISNEISGIAEILDSWKRQYVKQLQGVVVNYKHLSFSSPNGFIAPNRPFVYYNVKATFDLFYPKVGDVIKGEINHLSKEHITCLVEGTINVSIHLSSDYPQELAPFINLQRDILFEISSFKYDSKMVLSVKGKITRKCIQLMTELFPPEPFNSLVDVPELSNNTDEGIGTSSESADDGLLNLAFDDSKIDDDDDANFKKPPSNYTKSQKKSSKKPKSDSESSSMDTSDVSTSDEKPKKKKKKHIDKSNPDIGNYSNANNLPSDAVSSDTLIQNFSNFYHSEILDAIKKEESNFDGNARVKKHKKKQKRDLSPSLLGEKSKSNNKTFNEDLSNLGINAAFETSKSSQKRKRESESSFVDASEGPTTEEMPKKKKRKDESIPLEEIGIKNEVPDMPDDETITSTILSLKKEISSPVKTSNNFVPESKKKKKSKDKKSKNKDKPKKKKGKVLASGAVLKKDKKSQKKGSKKNKLDGEQSKKHKKGKSHKKDKSDKKKKKDVLKSIVM